MRTAGIQFLLLLAGWLVVISCGQKHTPPPPNPVFNSDPRLKDITDRIASEPSRAELYFQRGKMLRRLKEDTLALNDFKKASSLDTNNAQYYSTIGDMLFENKDIEGSVFWLQKAIAKNPTDPQAHLKIAKLFLYAENYPKVFEQVNIVLRKNIYDPEAYFLKGMAYKEMKDTNQAISNFQTALEHTPDFHPAIVQLGLIYSQRKDPLAIKYLDKAAAIDTGDVFPIFARGVYYQDKKDFEQAKKEYRHCIIRNTHYIDAYFNLGWILMQQDSTEKSFRQYDIVTKIQPDNPTAYYNRGICNELLKKPKEAVADYRRALVLDSSYASPKKALLRMGLSPTGAPLKKGN